MRLDLTVAVAVAVPYMHAAVELPFTPPRHAANHARHGPRALACSSTPK